MSATIGSYTNKQGKVYPTIVLQDEKLKFPFSIGYGKCLAILNHIEDIKEFVESNRRK